VPALIARVRELEAECDQALADYQDLGRVMHEECSRLESECERLRASLALAATQDEKQRTFHWLCLACCEYAEGDELPDGWQHKAGGQLCAECIEASERHASNPAQKPRDLTFSFAEKERADALVAQIKALR
jgi:hypothetical protein